MFLSMSRFCGNLLKSTCVEDRARDRRLSWLLLRVETSLSELGLCAFCCDWYEPQDIRCISLVSVFFCWKENSHVKNCCLYISFFDPLIIFQLFLFFQIYLLHVFFKIHFSWQKIRFFFFSFVFVEMNILQQPYFTPTTPWPVELCDSLVKVLGECCDDSHKSKCNQVCLFGHVDEVVPSGCWRVAASWLFFSLFVLHAWCSGSVRVDCYA